MLLPIGKIMLNGFFDILKVEPQLENTAVDYAPKPDYRPLTKFENRGIKLGHGVWDLLFTRK